MTDDTLQAGPVVPGLLLRVAAVAVIGGSVWMLQPGVVWPALAVALAVAGASFPQTGLAWFALAVVPLSLIVQPAGLWRTCVAVLALHLGFVLVTLASSIAARARVSLRALGPSALRFGAIQLPAQAVALLAALIPTDVDRGLGWAAPIGAVAVALLAVVLLWCGSNRRGDCAGGRTRNRA